MSIVDRMWSFGINKALDYLEKDPDTNIPKLLDWIDWLAPETFFPEQRMTLRQVMTERDSNWYQMIRKIYELDEGVRKQIFSNFIINIGLTDRAGVSPGQKEGDGETPWAVHIKDGEGRDDAGGLGLDFDVLDARIEEGMARGTHIFIFFDGGDSSWRDKLIALCNKHRGCIFSVVTTPESMEVSFAEDILRVRNLIPTIRLTGSQAEWPAMDAAVAILERYRLPFGVYCSCTGDNVEAATSDDSFDRMAQWNALYCCLQGERDVREGELPLSEEQKEMARDRVMDCRTRRPFYPVWHWSGDPLFMNRNGGEAQMWGEAGDWWQTIGELLNSSESEPLTVAEDL